MCSVGTIVYLDLVRIAYDEIVKFQCLQDLVLNSLHYFNILFVVQRHTLA